MNCEQFFQTATGNIPFLYQTRFATDDVLPNLVDVPTGIGKTAMAGRLNDGRIARLNPLNNLNA